jgi:hypothetical protein
MAYLYSHSKEYFDPRGQGNRWIKMWIISSFWKSVICKVGMGRGEDVSEIEFVYYSVIYVYSQIHIIISHSFKVEQTTFVFLSRILFALNPLFSFHCRCRGQSKYTAHYWRLTFFNMRRQLLFNSCLSQSLKGVKG